jgi:hypothetical protein
VITQQSSVSRNRLAIVVAFIVPAVLVQCGEASELLIGSAQVSITPSQPVALHGQVRTRIAREVESPVTATALALETQDGETVAEQALMVSCDLALIQGDIQDRLRQRLKERLPDFDNSKLFLAAIHSDLASERCGTLSARQPLLLDGDAHPTPGRRCRLYESV